uniref:Clathrin light chain n=1 Tax=Parascaris univalens TaxID=6257 RepID=A0A915AQI4_PARUN
CKASMRRGAFVMHVPVIGEAMSDPVADFLAREQDVLAGIDGAPLPAPAADSLPPTDNGSHFTRTSWNPAMFFTAPTDRPKWHSELNGFEELNTGGDSGVDLTILDSTHIPMARHSANTTPSPLTITSTPKVEPEKIRKWREEQKIILQKKDEAEERKKEEMRAAAKKELDEWYAQRAEQLRKTKAANRKLEQELLAERDSTEGGAEWDRIAKLCEFNTKNSKNTADVSRLRSLLLQLKSRKE